MTNYNAYMLRETTGTSGVLLTAQTAAGTLADRHFAHLVVGGIAVQEHGYPRVTTDADLVVIDVLEAVIIRRNLPRVLAVAPAVQHHYLEIWDALTAEK